MASSAQPDAAATSTLLLQAAEFGDLAALQRALADGASASVSTSHGTGALALAASKGHTTVVDALLRRPRARWALVRVVWHLQGVRARDGLRCGVAQPALVWLRPAQQRERRRAQPGVAIVACGALQSGRAQPTTSTPSV